MDKRLEQHLKLLNEKQREAYIKRYNEYLKDVNFSYSVFFAKLVAIVVVLFLIVIPLWKIVFPSIWSVLLGNFILIIKMLAFAFLFTLIIELIYVLSCYIQQERLFNEYFEIKPKSKGGKNNGRERSKKRK